MQFKNTLLVLATMGAMVSCQDKESDIVNKTPGNFIVTVTPTASTGVADYLLTSSSLDTGAISIKGQGVEQDGTYRYYVTYKNRFYSMLYGQGNPGAITVYDIQNGGLRKIANAVTETVQAFAPVNDDILMTKISRNITNPTISWYGFNTNTLQVDKQGSINSAELAANNGAPGELAFFSWIKQVGNKVYAPYFSVKGCCSATFGTAYPDQAWIAVYSYPEMKLEKVIKDDRISFIGRYFTDGLELTSSNEAYAFSSAVATSDGTKMNSTKPSAVVKINTATGEIDKSYFFNFEEVSGGLNITTWLYVGNNNFVVYSNEKAEKGAYATGKTIGVINVVSKTYKKVTGLPSALEISSFTMRNNYSPKDGRNGYIGVNLTSGVGYVYKIDASTATATRGLKVEGGTITAIEHLN